MTNLVSILLRSYSSTALKKKKKILRVICFNDSLDYV